MGPGVMPFMLDALAAYRLTRLITVDDILHEPREAIVEAAYVAAGQHSARRAAAEATTWAETAIADEHDAPKLATLVTCRWCCGVWCALAVVVLRRFGWWRPVRDVLAVGACAALIAGLEQ